MISLAGLTLATNRPKIARSILLEFSKHISEGMLPNRFPDDGEEAEYNTVDATLWYFEAVRAMSNQPATTRLCESSCTQNSARSLRGIFAARDTTSTSTQMACCMPASRACS